MNRNQRLTQASTEYLIELTRALAHVPRQESDETIAGVSEELLGLDDIQARAKIQALGDPATIALEALEASVSSRNPIILGHPDAAHDPQWYTVVTVLLVTVGGVIIPILGWIGGVLMLWASKTWETRHKVVGTLLAPIALGIPVLFAQLSWAFEEITTEVLGEGKDDFHAPLTAMPIGNINGFTAISILISIFVVFVIGGIWLLKAAAKLKRN